MTFENENLVRELSILGKGAHLSMSQRQKVRDQLFKKIGQLDLIDAVETKTEVGGLVMPLQTLLSIFKPRRMTLSLPATAGVVAAVFLGTFTTGALARNAAPTSGLLFTVRKAFESVEVSLESDPTKRAEIKIAIANDRIKFLENAPEHKLDTVLEESKKAIASAQTAVSSVEGENTDLDSKLAAIIHAQKDILTTISQGDLADAGVKEEIVAFKETLENIVTKSTPKAVVKKEAVTKVAPDEAPLVTTSFYGTLVTSYGRPALRVPQGVLVLVGSPVSLDGYIGRSNVNVIGDLSVDGNLTVRKITIDSKLIGEISDENINNADLSGVEGEQNTSLDKS